MQDDVNYSTFASNVPTSEEMREKVIAWNQNPALFWEDTMNAPGYKTFKDIGYAYFTPFAYHRNTYELCPYLECDIGTVMLSAEARGASIRGGNTGSWLEDVFTRRYDWELHRLPGEVIGEFVRQATEAAAVNGARYTREALDEFVQNLETVGRLESKIAQDLLFACLMEAAPTEALTVEAENEATDALEKYSISEKPAVARDIAQSYILGGDVEKARRLAICILSPQRVQAPRILTSNRTSSRSRRSPVRSAAKSSGDGNAGEDSDGGSDPEPPRPLIYTHRLILLRGGEI